MSVGPAGAAEAPPATGTGPGPAPDEPAAGPGRRRPTGGGAASGWRLDRTGVAVLVAMAAGLVLRVVWVAYAARRPVGLYDPSRYLAYARQIAAGKGYVEPLTGQATAYYPPGYPYFLGAVAFVCRHVGLGDHIPQAAGYVQAVLGTLTVGAAAVVARRIVNPAAGVIAAVVLALYPNLIFHTAALLGETLYNALFVGALAVLCWRPRSAGLSTRRLVAFSVLLGLAVLTRPISLVFVPLLGLVWWFDLRSWRDALRRTGIVVGVLVLLIAPWTVRNAVRMHAFVPMSTNTGDNLCIGHHPGASGAFDAFDPRTARFCDTGDGVQFGRASELRNDRKKTDRSLTYLQGHLGREPWLVWRRAFYMFQQDHDAVYAVQSYHSPLPGNWSMSAGAEDLFIHLADGYYAVVAPLGALGLVVLAVRRQPDGLLLVAAAVATASVPLLFFGDARFKVPVLPLLVIAAGCLAGLAVRAASRGRAAPVPAG